MIASSMWVFLTSFHSPSPPVLTRENSDSTFATTLSARSPISTSAWPTAALPTDSIRGASSSQTCTGALLKLRWVDIPG